MTTQTTTSTVTITGGELLDALAAIRPALSRARNAFPWERCVHLTAARGSARLECHTGEVSARVPLEAQCDQREGIDVWLDAQDFQRAVAAHATRRGPKARTALAVGVSDDAVTITAGMTSSTVAAADPDEMLSRIDPVDTTLVVERDRFVSDIAAAAACAESGPHALPILTGIHLAIGKIVCTDRYRLAYFELAGTGDLPEVTAPAARLTKMLKATAGQTLLIGADPERLTVRSDTMVATMRTIEGDYPNVTSIVRAAAEDGLPTLTLPRQVMTDLLKPHATGSNTVTITPRAEDLLLEVHSPNADGPVTVTTIPTTGSNRPEHAVAFNCHYLADIIKNHTGETITATTRAPLKPTGITSDAPGRLTILQPVRMAG